MESLKSIGNVKEKLSKTRLLINVGELRGDS
jgi:hypothetical protein